MADTYLHISGIPTISADALVDLNLRTKRAVQEKAGAAQDLVVVDQDTSGVTYVYTNATVAGDSAGDITVTGITTADTLVAVVAIADADQTATDLTSEFTITSADTINNDGGTDTTGDHLVVVYR